jgi:hypothetical protein
MPALVSRPQFRNNSLGTVLSPIGGLPALSDGGAMLIQCWDVGTGVADTFIILDVIRWRMASSFGEQPLAKSGMLGATASRRTGHSYVWEAEVVLDLRVQAELTLRESFLNGYTASDPSHLMAQIYFRLGKPFPDNIDVDYRYYWLPRAKIDAFSPMVEAGDKRRVRYKVAGCANCHCLLLPDQGCPNDPSTVAGAYAEYLRINPNA